MHLPCPCIVSDPRTTAPQIASDEIASDDLRRFAEETFGFGLLTAHTTFVDGTVASQARLLCPCGPLLMRSEWELQADDFRGWWSSASARKSFAAAVGSVKWPAELSWSGGESGMRGSRGRLGPPQCGQVRTSRAKTRRRSSASSRTHRTRQVPRVELFDEGLRVGVGGMGWARREKRGQIQNSPIHKPKLSELSGKAELCDAPRGLPHRRSFAERS